MNKPNINLNKELPSTKQLVKSTIIAAITGGILLVTVVMPSEYGIDPTGVGKVLGLQKMGEIKISLAHELELEKLATKSKGVAVTAVVAVVAPVVVEQVKIAILSDEMSVTLAPNEAAEIKAKMLKGSKVNYKWQTNGGRANYDIHGDSKKLRINYHNYEKGSKQEAEGTLVAAFDGSHGWFWRNRTSQSITITLQTNGEYTSVSRVQ